MATAARARTLRTCVCISSGTGLWCALPASAGCPPPPAPPASRFRAAAPALPPAWPPPPPHSTQSQNRLSLRCPLPTRRSRARSTRPVAWPRHATPGLAPHRPQLTRTCPVQSAPVCKAAPKQHRGLRPRHRRSQPPRPASAASGRLAARARSGSVCRPRLTRRPLLASPLALPPLKHLPHHRLRPGGSSDLPFPAPPSSAQ